MPDSRIVAALSAVVLISGVAAWAQPPTNSLVPGIAPYAPKAASAPSTAGGASAVAPVQVAPSYDYVLGAGDKLRIIVFGEENLTGEFVVAGNGRLSFPLIGEVQAAGKTVRALQDEITTALKAGYLKDPRISAEVLTFRPYYIFGEIAKPGEYPYSDGITVLNAVATAGGFTYRANQKYIFIKRANDAVEHKMRLTQEMQLSPGDTVRTE